MILNQIENEPITNVRRFVFIDKETLSFLNRYKPYDLLNAIILAVDYLFPGITTVDIWDYRDRFPYKEILSMLGERLYTEINELFTNFIYGIDVTGVLDIYYYDNVIILTIDVGDP